MTSQNAILEYLSQNKKRLLHEYHLVKIGIFGSYAREENTPSSDIDLLIEFEENTNDIYSLKVNMKNELERKFNIPVDICREKYIKPIFRNQIISEVKYV